MEIIGLRVWSESKLFIYTGIEVLKYEIEIRI